MEGHAGEYLKKRKMSLAFDKTPFISLSCKLTPVLYCDLKPTQITKWQWSIEWEETRVADFN